MCELPNKHLNVAVACTLRDSSRLDLTLLSLCLVQSFPYEFTTYNKIRVLIPAKQNVGM